MIIEDVVNFLQTSSLASVLDTNICNAAGVKSDGETVSDDRALQTEEEPSSITLESIFGEGATDLAKELDNKNSSLTSEAINEDQCPQPNTLEDATEGTSNKRLRGESVSSGGALGAIEENTKINVLGEQCDTIALEAKKQKLSDELGGNSSPKKIEDECMIVDGQKPLQEPDSKNQDFPEED